MTCGTACTPCTGDVAHLEADGGPAVPGVLQDVPLGRRGPPADQPDAAAAGTAAASCGPAANSPSAASDFFSCSSRASSSPTPTGRISVARSDSCPRGRVPLRLREDDDPRALARRHPRPRRTTCRKQVTLTEMSCDGSRSVRNTTPAPGRRDSWVICPSTHTAPSRSIHPPISRDTSPTGSGASGDVLRAMRASVTAGYRQRAVEAGGARRPAGAGRALSCARPCPAGPARPAPLRRQHHQPHRQPDRAHHLRRPDASTITATVTAAPSTGTSTCRHHTPAPPRRRTGEPAHHARVQQRERGQRADVRPPTPDGRARRRGGPPTPPPPA